MLDLRLDSSRSDKILPMPKSPFLSPFFPTAEELLEGVLGPTQSSSTLCTYLLSTSKPQSETNTKYQTKFNPNEG